MIQATAPGKIILFGEHAVVYGRPAIAAPVTQVTATATVTPAAPGSGLTISAPDLGHAFALSAAPEDNPLAAAARWSLAHLNQTSPPDVRLEVSATIPLGRGLGSGAAISTAIVRVIADFLGKPLPPAMFQPWSTKWKSSITVHHRVLITPLSPTNSRFFCQGPAHSTAGGGPVIHPGHCRYRDHRPHPGSGRRFGPSSAK
jgi:hypothetical protein